MRIAHVAVVAGLVLAAACRKPAEERPALAFEPSPRPVLGAPAQSPRVVVRASGDLFAVTVREAASGGADLVLVSSGDGGDHFGEPRVLNTVPGEVRAHVGGTPVLLLGPRSEFYAVWAGKTALRVARSGDYGRTFGAPVDVPTGGEGTPSFFTAEIAPDGTLLLAWLGGVEGKRTAPGTSFVSVAASRDGATFEVFPGVADAVCPCCRPALAADARGRWFVGYRAVRDGKRDVVTVSSPDRGRTWAAPVWVSADGWRINGCPHSGPALALAGDSLYAAWYSEAEGRPRLYWSRSRTGALAFEPRRALSDALEDANQPSLAVQGDAVYAAFHGRDATAGGGWAPAAAWVRRLSDGAAPPLRVPSGSGSAAAPQLVSLGAGRWLVAWTDKGDPPRAVVARARARP